MVPSLAPPSLSPPCLSLASPPHSLFASCPCPRLCLDLTSSSSNLHEVTMMTTHPQKRRVVSLRGIGRAALMCVVWRWQRLRARNRGGRHSCVWFGDGSGFAPAIEEGGVIIATSCDGHPLSSRPIPPHSGLPLPCAATPLLASSHIPPNLRHPRSS